MRRYLSLAISAIEEGTSSKVGLSLAGFPQVKKIPALNLTSNYATSWGAKNRAHGWILFSKFYSFEISYLQT